MFFSYCRSLLKDIFAVIGQLDGRNDFEKKDIFLFQSWAIVTTIRTDVGKG